MIAEDLQRRRSDPDAATMVASMATRSRRDRSSKLAAVLPLVVDPQCFDVHFSTEQVPAKVMGPYTDIMGAAQFAHRMRPPRIGALLSRLMQSADAIKLWSSGGVRVDSSNQCDIAARAVTLYLDRFEESAGADTDSSDDGESEFRRRRQRKGQDRRSLGSELEMHGVM
jgi:hypothetical protein